METIQASSDWYLFHRSLGPLHGKVTQRSCSSLHISLCLNPSKDAAYGEANQDELRLKNQQANCFTYVPSKWAKNVSTQRYLQLTWLTIWYLGKYHTFLEFEENFTKVITSSHTVKCLSQGEKYIPNVLSSCHQLQINLFYPCTEAMIGKVLRQINLWVQCTIQLSWRNSTKIHSEVWEFCNSQWSMKK